MLDQRRDDLARGAEVGERVGDDEGFQACEGVEGDLGDLAWREVLDVDAADVGERHGRRAKAGRVADGEIDLMLGRNARLEGDAVGLGLG